MSIDSGYVKAWCMNCGQNLPKEILNRLRVVDFDSGNTSGVAAPSAPTAPMVNVTPPAVKKESDEVYRVVPFVGRISTGFFSSDNASTVAQQLRAAIAQEAKAGWEFHSFAKVDVEVQPGCLASLFGARASYITFDQLIFRVPNASSNGIKSVALSR
jgi:hypothetical protein